MEGAGLVPMRGPDGRRRAGGACRSRRAVRATNQAAGDTGRRRLRHGRHDSRSSDRPRRRGNDRRARSRLLQRRDHLRVHEGPDQVAGGIDRRSGRRARGALPPRPGRCPGGHRECRLRGRGAGRQGQHRQTARPAQRESEVDPRSATPIASRQARSGVDRQRRDRSRDRARRAQRPRRGHHGRSRKVRRDRARDAAADRGRT